MRPSAAVADTIAERSEAELIALLTAACPTMPSPDGPGDDAAVLSLTPSRRVLTTDALIEGTHFLRAHPARSLGWKALASNLSDVAAMGATPEAFVLSLALPPTLPLAYFEAFAEGLGAYAALHAVHLAGGDTVRTNGPLMISITAWGQADALLLRTTGVPGDVVMVCGPIGRAGHGLDHWLQTADRDTWSIAPPADIALLEHHLQPTPPLWAGPWAVANGARAGMDLSDGLATDLPRLALASDLVIEVDLDLLPAEDLLLDVDPHVRAAHGEDYSLVVLVPPAYVPTFAAQGFVAIGRALPTQSPLAPADRVVWRRHGQPTTVTASFSHFR